jgi:propanol-preferring alcohol dehydrogenase
VSGSDYLASAHIAIQVARYWGCEVYVFSRNEHHRKLAEQLGAVWTGTTDQVPPHLLHRAISFAPSGDLVPKALGVLRRGGTLALAGIYVTPIPTFDYSLLYHERTLHSVANSTRKDAIDFLKIAAEIPVQTEVEVFPLAEANRALQLLKESKIQGAGVLKIR